MHFNLFLLSSYTLLVCQAADAPPLSKNVVAPVKSLKSLVWESYPDIIINKQNVSDFDYAFVLGTAISAKLQILFFLLSKFVRFLIIIKNLHYITLTSERFKEGGSLLITRADPDYLAALNGK